MNLTRVKNYFEPNAILDIGAHEGEFAKLAREAFPSSSIICIEGNPECEPFLKETNSEYIITYLGSSNKKTILYKTKDCSRNTGDSIYKEITHHYDEDRVIEHEIYLQTIDTLFDETISFDLIKIDTQGSELDILSGGITLFKKAKGIILEVSLIKYNEGAPLYDDVVTFMTKNGFYEADIIDETMWSNNTINFLQRDILFLNKNLS